MTKIFCDITTCKYNGTNKICKAKSIKLNPGGYGYCSEFKPVKKLCACYREETDVNGIKQGRCWGTKECERCNCRGDVYSCDFYEKGLEK